ncbi:MAG TPA: hypothetical protein DEF68_08945 [Elusimicrobia bacterium]|nr:hypothetical protein [Elusimicrobiota bacterium]
MLVTAAGLAYVNNSHRNIPTDLRDAVIDGAALDSRFAATEQGNGTVPIPKAPAHAETGAVGKGYIGGSDPSLGVPERPVEWVTIPGGKFMMGTDSVEKGFESARPIHTVTIKTFDMARTEVTVAQYNECVVKGKCTEPDTNKHYCNWLKAGRQDSPVNCLSWKQADEYAKFKDARLPSESEWEYAATGGGKNHKYPWGNDEPTCDYVIMRNDGVRDCGYDGTMPVCSRPGKTEQRLCDMAGNVAEWVRDVYRDSYEGAPGDGGAVEGSGLRVMRGGSFRAESARYVRADKRGSGVPEERYGNVGFRLARSR